MKVLANDGISKSGILALEKGGSMMSRYVDTLSRTIKTR